MSEEYLEAKVRLLESAVENARFWIGAARWAGERGYPNHKQILLAKVALDEAGKADVALGDDFERAVAAEREQARDEVERSDGWSRGRAR